MPVPDLKVLSRSCQHSPPAFSRRKKPALFPRWLVVGLALLAALAASPARGQDVPVIDKDRPGTFQNPHCIEFSGVIDFRTDKYFRDRLAKAQRAGADLVIIEIDSPGGLKTVSLELAELLRDVDWAYTLAFIPREAISGGALVSLGCDEIAGSPTMRIGDIGEIAFDEEFWAFRLVPAKIQSVLVRQVRDLAVAKRRPPELAEAMIDKDVLVFVQPGADGQRQYQTVRVDEPRPDAPWELVEESGPERFLTLSGARAAELGLIETLASDRAALLEQLGVTPDGLVVHRRTTGDEIVYLLNTTLVTALLLIIGVLALYLELSAPGIGAGGIVAALCALLFFGSRFFGGTAGWLEVTLFLAGLALIGMELFVIPGFGVAGVSGLCLMAASAVLASQSFVIPATAAQWNQTITSLVMLIACGCVILIGAAWITKRFGSLPVFNQLVLAPRFDQAGEGGGTIKPAGDKPPQPAHPLVSVGDWGKTDSPLRPAGRVRFAGRSLDVISDGSFVEAGRNVRVVSIQGSIVTVAPVPDDAGSRA